jgi:hypothetical protein
MSLSEPNPRVIEVLENALISARRGEIQAVGVVGVSSLGTYRQAAAGPAEQIYVGCEMLQNFLLGQVAALQGQNEMMLGERN